jgi:hypothetical protein
MAVKNRNANAGIYDPVIDYPLPIESKAKNKQFIFVLFQRAALITWVK